MKRQEVESLLGQPLRILGSHGDFLCQYTQDGKCWFWDFAWHAREISFKDDKVSEVVSQTYYD